MCRKEQSYNISDKLTLNTFELQVQPFDVKKNMFSTGMYMHVGDAELITLSQVFIKRKSDVQKDFESHSKSMQLK